MRIVGKMTEHCVEILGKVVVDDVLDQSVEQHVSNTQSSEHYADSILYQECNRTLVGSCSGGQFFVHSAVHKLQDFQRL